MKKLLDICKTNKDEKNNEERLKNPFSKYILSSTHINFLFGAGVNGDAFPQISEYKKTEEMLNNLGGDISNGIEQGIDKLEKASDREKIKECFKEELRDNYKKYKERKELETIDSLKNMERLMKEAYSIVKNTENRTASMRQINVYTLNYDDILEDTIEELGFFYNCISARDVNKKSLMFDMIGYNYKAQNTIPMILISKLHGTLDDPILPGKEKYREVLDEKYFEIIYNMKENLCRDNSILIVVGYSGNDEHINSIIRDCINRGLIVFWYKYKKEEKGMGAIETNIHIREQKSDKGLEDTTKICSEDMGEAWREK